MTTTETLGISLHRIALFQTEVSEAAPGKPVHRPRGAVAEGSEADILQRPVRARTATCSVAARLAEVMREAFRQPRLDYLTPTVLRKIAGYDATSFVRFVLALEAEFGVTLQEHEVDQIETMGDVLALVRGKLPVIAETVLPEMAK